MDHHKTQSPSVTLSKHAIPPGERSHSLFNKCERARDRVSQLTRIRTTPAHPPSSSPHAYTRRIPASTCLVLSRPTDVVHVEVRVKAAAVVCMICLKLETPIATLWAPPIKRPPVLDVNTLCRSLRGRKIPAAGRTRRAASALFGEFAPTYDRLKTITSEDNVCFAMEGAARSANFEVGNDAVYFTAASL